MSCKSLFPRLGSVLARSQPGDIAGAGRGGGITLVRLWEANGAAFTRDARADRFIHIPVSPSPRSAGMRLSWVEGLP